MSLILLCDCHSACVCVCVCVSVYVCARERGGERLTDLLII